MRHLLTLLSIFTLLTTLHAQVPSYVPTDGLVGWWPFNGNANDESGNGNNGVVNGATLTEDRFGNADAAYQYDGIDDHILIELGQTTNNWSFGFWFNSNNANTFEQEYMIGNGNVNYSTGIGVSGGVSPAILGTKIFSYDGETPLTNVLDAGEYFTGTNYHVVLHSNGVMQYIYVNALLVDSLPMNTITLNEIALGTRLDMIYYFEGILDDIGIWNRALDECEIQALYNAGAQGVSPTPVSFSGLNSSYTLADQPSPLSGTPAGGVFIGPGVTGNTFDPASAGVGSHSITYAYVDACGSVNVQSFCTEVTVTSGVGGSNMTTGGVLVYPNPNRGQFTVELELSGLVSLQVFDARGALVHNEVFTASGARTQRILDLSTLAKGSYTLLVEHNGQRVSQAVVVE
jgi:hypothetical protein